MRIPASPFFDHTGKEKAVAKWLIAHRGGDFAKTAQTFGISPVLARLMRNRGIIGDDAVRKYLYGSLADLHDPFLLHDCEKACGILTEKLREGKKIRIIGDYDVDGICASFILLHCLRALGADVSAVLPDRVKDGYGLNVSMITQAAMDGVDTILTCDNGIAASDAVSKAKSGGMTVIVTDHHEIPFHTEPDGTVRNDLPQADAIVEPKLGDSYPFRDICGAVVAAKLMQALFCRCGQQDHPALSDLLPFAALATVCDVMPLRDENRVIVKEGLKALQETENPGMRALIRTCGLDGKLLSTYHAGFILGPCLNASGRLDTAERALHLFADAGSPAEAMSEAGVLKDLNESRKTQTAKNVEAGIRLVREGGYAKDPVLVLFLPDCHESIAGIVAGKIRETYEKPVFVLTHSGEEGVLKGSGRSIEAYDMYAEMNKVSDLFLKFGGHKAAAGLSIREEDLPAFRRRINEQCTLTAEEETKVLHLDMELTTADLNFELLSELDFLEPCDSQANPRPLFVCRDMRLLSARLMGKSGRAVRFGAADALRRPVPVVWFGDVNSLREKMDARYGEGTFEALLAGKCSPDALPHAHVAFRTDINEWRGERSIQMIAEDFLFI